MVVGPIRSKDYRIGGATPDGGCGGAIECEGGSDSSLATEAQGLGTWWREEWRRSRAVHLPTG